jgi:purine nucleosidase
VSETPTMVVVDTDTGIDDAMGVAYALVSPRLDVLALTTVFGNVDVDRTTRNTLSIPEQLGVPAPPVSRGAARAFIEPPVTYEFVHGSDGVGDAGFPPPSGSESGEHAAQTIVRLAKERPGEVVLVPIGPLTNLALALMLEPELPSLVKRVVWMGGVVMGPGNVTPVAEADAALDPEAVRMVLGADWPVTMVGLDITDRVLFERSDYDRLHASGSSAARYVTAIAPFYMSFYEKILGRWACAMHSPLTVAIAADPSLVTETLTCPVSVELAPGITRGMTVADRRGGREEGAREGLEAKDVEVVLDVDIDRFKAEFMEVIGDER